MNIVQKFIKASLKEANRNNMSIAYNSNISKSERLAIILAKNLNGKILEKDKVYFLLQFDLPQNYSLKIDNNLKGRIFLDGEEIFYWHDLSFVKDKDINYLTADAKDGEDRFNVPVDVSLAALKLAVKIVSIKEAFNEQNLPNESSYDHRKSARSRRNVERYKKEQAYYRNLFVKSGAISEEDLAKYIISIHTIKCEDYETNIDYYKGEGSAIFDSEIAFIFKDTAINARYDIIFSVRFAARAEGRRHPGSYWDPPEDEDWLIGVVWDDEVDADYSEIKTNGPTNDELEEHLIDIVYNFAESGMLAQYLEDNLEDITEWEIR